MIRKLKQKFSNGSFVQVTNEMPPWMSHFPRGFKAVVIGTYKSIYGGSGDENWKSYCLLMLDKNGTGCNEISWYYEYQLTKIPGRTGAGMILIQDYRDKGE